MRNGCDLSRPRRLSTALAATAALLLLLADFGLQPVASALSRASGRHAGVVAVKCFEGAHPTCHRGRRGHRSRTVTPPGAPSGTPTPTPPVPGGPSSSPGATPSSPPAQVCGNAAVLDGPSAAPPGAIVVAAGDNSSVNWSQPGATFWFASGTHRLGSGQYNQIIPADNTTFVGAPGAVLDGQRKNQYAFTQHATGVTIEHLTIQNFVSPRDEGVVNHDSGSGWTIQNDTVTKNSGGGVFLGSGNTARNNCLAGNGQYGFQVYSNDGAPDGVTLDHNEIAGNNTDNWEAAQPGCGCTGGGKFWAARNVTVTNNYVHDNKSVGLWADTNNVGFDFEGNYISGNDAEGIFYEISYNAVIRDNTFLRNGLVKGPNTGGFPVGAIYLSESGGDSRVSTKFSTLDVSSNVFRDNWSGVVLWENADRFCGSPANTSTGTCTLGDPSGSNLSTCVAATIKSASRYADCRWKTQNVSVHDNTFSLDKSAIPGCAGNSVCGLQGLFSNWGTYPSWSPYKGPAVEDAITFSQNNHFTNNTYTGPWRFMALDQGTILDFRTWQTAPFSQDAGSTSN